MTVVVHKDRTGSLDEPCIDGEVSGSSICVLEHLGSPSSLREGLVHYTRKEKRQYQIRCCMDSTASSFQDIGVAVTKLVRAAAYPCACPENWLKDDGAILPALETLQLQGYVQSDTRDGHRYFAFTEAACLRCFVMEAQCRENVAKQYTYLKSCDV
jgi:hypothetical protein